MLHTHSHPADVLLMQRTLTAGKMTVQGGMVKSITVRSSRTCVAKVTQTSTEGAFSMASASSIEVYGVDKTASVSVTATTPVTITTAAAPALPNGMRRAIFIAAKPVSNEYALQVLNLCEWLPSRTMK
jgi:hypothetical protein